MGGVGRLQHLYRFEGFLAGAVEYCIYRIRIHGFECGTDGRRIGVLSCDPKVLQTVDCDRGYFPIQGAWHLGSQGDCAKGGMALPDGEGLRPAERD